MQTAYLIGGLIQILNKYFANSAEKEKTPLRSKDIRMGNTFSRWAQKILGWGIFFDDGRVNFTMGELFPRWAKNFHGGQINFRMGEKFYRWAEIFHDGELSLRWAGEKLKNSVKISNGKY